MNKDILNMVKKVSIINLMIGIVAAFIIQILFKNFGLFVMIGMITAVFNFFINSQAGELIFKRFRNSSVSLYIISFFIRIGIAAGIGYAVFMYNKYDAVAYLFGYTSHLMGIYVYSVIKNN
ncbi:MAG: ATP synthase subunit I [Clostridium sp.]|jgi:ATP synthase protein I|uniref:ATP synthase subunit I n=1 Tax=Clostridium sp. TaxID=1506 RepID=UPI0025B99E96|nr:ATP synthase subunit I [Clostridium sp.]MCH3965293.1 ATP synthase subunit I [Clostridium sp.]MCI1714514.1 ATP synthase subunit I [Clostridium sp.]MCI1798776.1 ATP synthase subunit I [Clostridium sp.]MCI1812493.1 ATP synthase subunit I [Clostridium sp.]MCI1869586.1 ATP synthase subunit I [Clostridium sp.]